MDETPRTLIRNLAKESTGSLNPKAEFQRPPLPKSKKQRGGAGVSELVEDETPRRLITALAAGLATDSNERILDQAEKPNKKIKTDSNSSNTPLDPRKIIRNYLRVAKTDSREKELRTGSDEEFDVGWETSETEPETLEEKEELRDAEVETTTVVGLKGKRKQKRAQYRPRIPRTGEVPFPFIASRFKAFLGTFPKPNTALPEALDVAHAAIAAYLEQSLRDYARLARLDDASTHNLTKTRVENLLREQGLLIKPLGDEIRRLLDREDADTVLGLPMSRARAEKR